MADLLHKEITGAIIGAYYEVYNHTSRVYPEHIYERAMIEELKRRGYPTTQQDEYRIFYKDKLVGVQRLDLFVVGEVVIENKAVEKLSPLNRAQGLSYLKTTGKTVALLLNFRGIEPEFDRLYFDPNKRSAGATPTPLLDNKEQAADWLYPELAYAVVGALYEVHYLLGPGYIQRIYANACYHELGLRNLAPVPAKRMQVAYKGIPIGDVALRHITVEQKIMVFPIALHNMNAMHLDSVKDWLKTCDIKLGIIANFDAVHLHITFVRL